MKRVTCSPASRHIRLTSDPGYPDIGDCDPADIDLVGRVIWVGRQLLDQRQHHGDGNADAEGERPDRGPPGNADGGSHQNRLR